MNMILRVGTISGSLLAVLCLAGGPVACTTQEAGGTGGSVGSGGATVGSGGATAAGGTTGSSDGSGTLCLPPQQDITNFTYALSDAGTTSTKEVRFGSEGTLQGGQNYYPTSGTNALTSDVTQSNWHISGTVGDYSGFALYFDSGSTKCDRVDASAFKGISFTISGSVPHGNAITLAVGTAGDTPSGTWMHDVGGLTTAKATDVGRCTPTSGNQYYHPGCGDPTTQIPVTASPTPQTVNWANLTGGTPEASPNPSEITSIYWILPWTGSGDTAYAVDLVLDDIKFIP
jgi:hypothetical protein